MATAIRYTALENTTGGLITEPTITLGQDLGTQVIKRKIVAAEIGTALGQTRDAQNPRKGLLFAKCYGPPIQVIGTAKLMKPAVVNNSPLTWNYFPTAIGNQVVNIVFTIDNSVKGVSSLYILDYGADNTVQIVNGDIVLMTIAIGSSL